jgi:hypothetical protein
MWMLARCRVPGLSRTASTAPSGAWNVGVVRVLVLSVRCWVLREHAKVVLLLNYRVCSEFKPVIRVDGQVSQ